MEHVVAERLARSRTRAASRGPRCSSWVAAGRGEEYVSSTVVAVRGADAERHGLTDVRIDSHAPIYGQELEVLKKQPTARARRARASARRNAAARARARPCRMPTASRPRAVRRTPGVRQYEASPRSVAASSTSMIAAAVAQTSSSSWTRSPESAADATTSVGARSSFCASPLRRRTPAPARASRGRARGTATAASGDGSARTARRRAARAASRVERARRRTPCAFAARAARSARLTRGGRRRAPRRLRA